MPEVDERTIRTNGVDLHVLEAGTGTPVVLAHGFPELALLVASPDRRRSPPPAAA